MIDRRRLHGMIVFAVTAAMIPCSAFGSPAHLDNMEPAGIERGKATELKFTGAGLEGNPRLVAPFRFQSAPGSKVNGAWTIRVTADPATPVGVYPVRIQTDGGLSNPILLAVGQYPQIVEKEDESQFDRAMMLPATPIIVEGRLDGNDVDYFRFHGRAGERIVVDAMCARIGSGVDPTIRLTSASASRKYVASADDSPGLEIDARLTAVLPSDGDYVIEISDSRYQGANRPLYRMLVGAVPVADEVYPLGGRAGETLGLELRGGTLAGVESVATRLTPIPGTAIAVPRFLLPPEPGSSRGFHDADGIGPLAVSSYPELRESTVDDQPIRAIGPVVFNGRIDPPGDTDQFIVATEPGKRLHIEVQASAFGSALDGIMEVKDEKGGVIVTADDTVVNRVKKRNNQAQAMNLADPSTDITVPGGVKEITLVLRDLAGRGGIGYPYRIVVEPISEEFELDAGASEFSIPRGGHATISATVNRKGYNGAITLTVADPPAGVTIREGIIPAGQKTGALSLTAAQTAEFAPAPVRLVGRGQGPAGTIERTATETVVFVKDADPPLGTVVFHGVTLAPAVAPAVGLDVSAAPVEVAHGFTGTIPITITRPKGVDDAFRISARDLPTGCSVQPVNIAAKATSGTISVKTILAAPTGKLSLALQAEGKVQGKDQKLDLPLVTLNVVPPVAIEMAAAKIQVKPGTTFELKGKLVRKGGIKGPVTLKLTGLPAGLKSDPITADDKTAEFTFKVAAEPRAAPADVKGQITPAYKVENKDYPTQPLPIEIVVPK